MASVFVTFVGIGAVIACDMPGPIAQAPTTSRSSARKMPADQHSDRQILQYALLELGEIDVEHHHHEQEKHRNRADVHDDQDHREKFGTHHHEQACRVHEGQDEIEHGVHGIAGGNHHEGTCHADAGKQIKEQRARSSAHLYGASSAMFLAISRSQRSPFASRRSLS